MIKRIEEERKHGKEKPIEYEIENECWISKGHYLDKDRYPTVKRDKKCWQMNRYIYTLFKGAIPDGLVVMHTCDMPDCINPDHLKAGTQSENMIDMVKKGRHPNIKLTPSEIIAIRNDDRTSTEIAKDYQVSQATISNIKTGKSWGHVE